MPRINKKLPEPYMKTGLPVCAGVECRHYVIKTDTCGLTDEGREHYCVPAIEAIVKAVPKATLDQLVCAQESADEAEALPPMPVERCASCGMTREALAKELEE